MKKILFLMFLTCICTNVLAKPTSSRDSLSYHLDQFALHTITTNPVQPNQPVYAWRTHLNFDGSPGIHTQNAKLIGYTNGNGILNIVVQKLPHDFIHCGNFYNERVAVGSPTSAKSNSLNFTIMDGLSHFGPVDPNHIEYRKCFPVQGSY